MPSVNQSKELAVASNNSTIEIIIIFKKIFFRLIPVSLSIMASYVSAILVLGYPAEMYAFGGQWILHAVGTAIGAALACVLFVPLFYPLKLTSINEVSASRTSSQMNSCYFFIHLHVFRVK